MGKRDRTRAFLTEFIIVVLFFSIAAVVTIQLFVAASEKSKDAKEYTNAYALITDKAERILAAEDIDSLRQICSAVEYYDKDFVDTDEKNAVYTLYCNMNIDEASGEPDTYYATGVIAVKKGNESVANIELKKYIK